MGFDQTRHNCSMFFEKNEMSLFTVNILINDHGNEYIVVEAATYD